MDLNEQYKQLVRQYVEKMKELRKAERKREDDSIVLFIDRERNEIHNQLRKLAPSIGKSAGDIYLDILFHEKSLQEYQLPEFSITRAGDVFIDVGDHNLFLLDGDNKEELIKGRRKKELLSKAFIPFGSYEWWHLSEEYGFPKREIWELENRRRLKKLVELSDGHVQNVELFSGRSFHTGTSIYGALFDSEDIHKILAIISEYKQEISIDHHFYNKEVVQKDVLELAKKDIEDVLSKYPADDEDRPMLIERLWKDVYQTDHLFMKEMEEQIRTLFEEAKEKGAYLDHLDEVNAEVQKVQDFEVSIEDRYSKDIDRIQGVGRGRK